MSEKKKILFLIESFIVGGAEKVLMDIVNHIDPETFDVTVCSIFKESIYPNYKKKFTTSFASHIHYRYLINNRIPGLALLFNFLVIRIPSLLFHLLVRRKYDSIIAFYEGRPTQWIAEVEVNDCKKIAWLHTSTKLSQQGKSQAQLIQEEQHYQCFAQIIAVSEEVKSSFVKTFPSMADKVKTIYNPINSDQIQQQASESIKFPSHTHPLFVCVGRIAEVKGYNRLLHIIKTLKDQRYEFQFWIIGGGDAYELQQYIDQNQLKNYVSLLGHQSNPYPYMMEADCIVISSFIEGLSTVVLESLTLGKALISTDCGGSKELLGDSVYGILTENSESGLLNGIKSILEDPSLLTHFSSMAKKRRSLFDLNDTIKSIETTLSTC